MAETKILGLRGIAVRDLRPDPGNVREDMGDLSELGRSLVEQGVLQPLLVQMGTERTFRVIDGHRRYFAACRVGLQTLPCLVTARKSSSSATLTMLSAAMHKPLSPIEEARAFNALVEVHHLDLSEIARMTGYSVRTVRGRMDLDALPEEVKARVEAKALSVTAATDLARQVRTRTSGSVTNRLARSPFTFQHRLANQVQKNCTHKGSRVQVGGVGCGQCWEATIRADERTVVAETADRADDEQADGASLILLPVCSA